MAATGHPATVPTIPVPPGVHQEVIPAAPPGVPEAIAAVATAVAAVAATAAAVPAAAVAAEAAAVAAEDNLIPLILLDLT